MKGIILAGGKGTRLFPLTLSVSKQLLPVYDKPMIYYPLSMLMLAGIREILIITAPDQTESFMNVLGDGKKWGMNFSYIIQDHPRGLADAFIVGENFIGNSPVAMTLGDNIFYGRGMVAILQSSARLEKGAIIFAYPVKNPHQFGVVEINKDLNPVSIEEKPAQPKSNFAVPGIYFYDNRVCSIAKELEPSDRGELEITDLNNKYLSDGSLKVNVLGRGIAWLDAGTYESLLQAANFVQAVEERQGLMISCPEEIAYRMGYIDKDQLIELGKDLSSNLYGEYLLNLAKEEFI
jgi:glucose-1-phosphate thymidylyltransferase